MAQKRDIDIEPLEFVQSFVSAGIFKFNGESLDFNLMGDKIRFSEATSFTRLAARRRGLARAIRYVGESDADLQRKQQLLDLQKALARRAAREALEHAEEKAEVNLENSVSPEDKLSQPDNRESVDDIPRAAISAHWSAACVLLSSGAERIEAEPKRRLAKGLIALGCRIAESWTAERASVDFSKVRKAILDEEAFLERKQHVSAEVWAKLRTDVDQFIHIWEFSFLTGPYRTVLSALCGQGQGNVLRRSVREVSLERRFEKLTQSVWVSELEPDKAKGAFKQWLKRIEGSIVLQFVLAEHFVDRVYWDKWKESDRKTFLDIASSVMEGLGEHLDKGKVERIIGSKKRTRRSR